MAKPKGSSGSSGGGSRKRTSRSGAGKRGDSMGSLSSRNNGSDTPF
jgi:hypothetical protein